MTTSPEPHYTIYQRSLAEDWIIYRVVPLGKVGIGKCWDEAICVQAEIIEVVGKARGIANNSKKHFKPGYWVSGKGSRVYWKKVANFQGNPPPRRPREPFD